MKNRLKVVGVNALLFLLGLGVALFMIEMTLRLLFPADERGWTVVHEADVELGWRYVPNAQQWYTSPGEFRVHLETNNLRQRDIERQYSKSEDVYRIIMLGDSFVASLQTPLTQTFTYIVEENLNKTISGEKSIEVLNAGTGGYGTDQELRWFRLEGIKYQPDKVVLAMFLGNDIADNDFELWGLAGSIAPPKPFFKLEDDNLKDIGLLRMNDELADDQGLSIVSVRRFLQRYSSAFIFLNANMKYFESNEMFQGVVSVVGKGDTNDSYNHAYDVFRVDHSSEWSRAWKLTEHILLALKREVEASGAVFEVILIPHPVQIHQDWWRARLSVYPAMKKANWDLSYPNKRLSKFLSDQDIQHLDLKPMLQDYVTETSEYIYYRSDGHFTPKGNRVVAELILDWLTKRKK